MASDQNTPGVPGSSAPAITWPVVRDEATGAAVGCPPTWQRLENTLTAITLAAPLTMIDEGQFRPNLTLTVHPVPKDAADLQVYCPAVVEGMLQAIPGSHVLAVDRLTLPRDHPARQILFAYREPPHAVVLLQYLTIVEHLATTVSASCAVAHFETLLPAFEACLAAFEPGIRERTA